MFALIGRGTMPYRWTEQDAGSDTKSVILDAWPNQSMTREGFVWFMGATLILVSLPLLTVLGSPILWFLLFFFGLAIAGLWWAINAQKRSVALREQLVLGQDAITLTRNEAGKPDKTWQANTYWVTVHLHADAGPVESYLTLKGNGREVEFGAYLSVEERKELYEDLSNRLRRA